MKLSEGILKKEKQYNVITEKQLLLGVHIHVSFSKGFTDKYNQTFIATPASISNYSMLG